MTEFSTGLPPSGKLHLQQCDACGQWNYPARELCGNCLADALEWRPAPDTGTVQTLSELHYSLESTYAAQLPWKIASVKLDCGAVILAHLAPGIATGDAVVVKTIEDGASNRMLVAAHSDEAAQQTHQQWLHRIGFKEIST